MPAVIQCRWLALRPPADPPPRASTHTPTVTHPHPHFHANLKAKNNKEEDQMLTLKGTASSANTSTCPTHARTHARTHAQMHLDVEGVRKVAHPPVLT